MAVKTREELINQLKTKFGEDTGDDVLAILEDVTDTMADLEKQVADSGDWKKQAEDIDRVWRKKYSDRFMGLTEKEEEQEKQKDPEEMKEEEGPTRYEDLFTVVETK